MCRSGHPVLPVLFMSYHRFLNASNTTGPTSGAELRTHFGASEFSIQFYVGFVLLNSHFSVQCFIDLVVLLSLLCFVLAPLLLVIVLFVLRFTSFDYPFGIFLILLMNLLMNSERVCVHGCLNLCSLQSELIPNKKNVSGQKSTINKAKSQFSGKKRNECTFIGYGI